MGVQQNGHSNKNLKKVFFVKEKKKHFNANFPKKKISGNFHNCRKQRFG